MKAPVVLAFGDPAVRMTSLTRGFASPDRSGFAFFTKASMLSLARFQARRKSPKSAKRDSGGNGANGESMSLQSRLMPFHAIPLVNHSIRDHRKFLSLAEYRTESQSRAGPRETSPASDERRATNLPISAAITKKALSLPEIEQAFLKAVRFIGETLTGSRARAYSSSAIRVVPRLVSLW